MKIVNMPKDEILLCLNCKQLGADGIQRKILSMKNPETEYQCLCANCNWIKRYENGEHK